MSKPDTAVVVVAGGEGVRFGHAGGKQMALVAGRPLLAYTVEACCSPAAVDLVVLVAPAERLDEYHDALADVRTGGASIVSAPAGARRQDSVASGIAAVPDHYRYIAIHDGARALVTAAVFAAARTALDSDEDLDGVVVGHPSYDTLKRVDAGVIVETPDRSEYWVAQTPQVFDSHVLRSAYEDATRKGLEGTDDASLVEAIGGTVGVVEGSRDNIKVTVASDLALAEAVLLARRQEAAR